MLKRSTVRNVCCSAVVCVGLLAPGVLHPQTQQDEENEGSVGTLKVQVDVVNVFFNV